MKGLNSAEIQCFCWNEFHGHLWCHTFVPEASSFTANSLLLYWGNGQPGFHNSLFNPGFLFWINWMSIWGSRRSSDLHGLHIRKGAKCIPCGKGQVLRVYCSPWKPSGMLGFQACTLFPPPAPPPEGCGRQIFVKHCVMNPCWFYCSSGPWHVFAASRPLERMHSE